MRSRLCISSGRARVNGNPEEIPANNISVVHTLSDSDGRRTLTDPT